MVNHCHETGAIEVPDHAVTNATDKIVMTLKTYQFRSRSEREREVDLARNYGAIGNRAIVAASQDCCKDKAGERGARDVNVAGRSARTPSKTAH